MNVHRPKLIIAAAHTLARMVALAALTALTTSGCGINAPRIVKIGLVAPFEGRYREIGYDVIPAARLAIREWAETTASTRVAVELVAYDDGGDPERALEQARKLIADPSVMIVIGHWRNETTRAALPFYKAANLPVLTFVPESVEEAPLVYNLAPSRGDLLLAAQHYLRAQGNRLTSPYLDTSDDVTLSATQLRAAGSYLGGPAWGLSQFYPLAGDRAEGAQYVAGVAFPRDLSDTQEEQVNTFVQKYSEANLGTPPGPLAPTAYDATRVALLALNTCTAPLPSRKDVGTAIAQVVLSDGLTGSIRFDESGQRLNAPIFLYAWQGGERVLIEQLR